MQLTGNFNIVAGLELIQVILQLLGILMLVESRCDRALSTTLGALTSSTGRSARMIRARNVLTANLMTVQNSNLVADLQLIQICTSVVQRCHRHKQTIGLLATQLNCSHISLGGIHIAAGNIYTIFINCQKSILLTVFHRKLQIGLKIDTDLALKILVLSNANSAIKTSRQDQAVRIGVRTHILQSSNIATMTHYTFSFLNISVKFR